MNHAVVNVRVQVSVWVPVGSSFNPVDHMVILCLACWGTPKLVSTVAVSVTFPSVMPRGSDFSISSPKLVILSRWYLIVIAISLIASDIEHFSFVSWQFMYLWRNVYSSSLSIFEFNIWVLCCWVVGLGHSFCGFQKWHASLAWKTDRFSLITVYEACGSKTLIKLWDVVRLIEHLQRS